MIQIEQFSNFAQTQLTMPATAGTTSLTVNSVENFPASGQFRIVVDAEVFLVIAISENTLSVIPAYEGTIASNHSAGALVTHTLTAGVASMLTHQGLGIYNFLAYAPSAILSATDVTTLLQNFLLYCQLQALALKLSALDDQAQRTYVTAYLPRGTYYITSPIIVPELVNLLCDGVIIRNGSHGTITANYTGDTTSLALANLYMPAIIIVPRAHCKGINLYCNNDGVHLGAGMFVGKNWQIATMTIANAGSGYQVGDVITLAQPSLAPYAAGTAQVTAITQTGGITALQLVNAGAYSLPPFLQQQQWTTSNGFSVFDAYGNFLSTGGNGSGATIRVTWQADWSSGNTSYNMGSGGLIADSIIEHIRIMHVDLTTDSTYGTMDALHMYGLNMSIDDVELQGGVNGINFNHCADVRASRLNSVGSKNGLVIYGCTNLVATDVVIDTPSGILQIDQSQGVFMSGRLFNRNVVNFNGSNNYTIALGLNSASTPGLDLEAIILNFELTNAGSGTTSSVIAGNPALYIAYAKNCSIDLAITNTTNATVASPITSFAVFGAGVDNSVRLRGSIDQASGALFSGSTNCAVDIWDVAIQGYARPYGTYEIYGSGAPSSGSNGTGSNKAGAGSSYIDTLNAVRYINMGNSTSPNWSALAIV